jgi:hypothetical protein
MTVRELKAFEGKFALLTCGDGEVIRAKIVFVDAEYRDVIVDVTNTSNPHKWPEGHPTSDCAYTLSLTEIKSVEELSL